MLLRYEKKIAREINKEEKSLHVLGRGMDACRIVKRVLRRRKEMAYVLMGLGPSEKALLKKVCAEAAPQMSKRSRRKLYQDKSTAMIVPEKAFLFDLLRNVITEDTKIKVLYFLTESADNVRRFIFHAGKLSINVISSNPASGLLQEMADELNMAIGSVHLYPRFRGIVRKSIAHFEFKEAVIRLGEPYEELQVLLGDIIAQIGLIPSKGQFQGYLHWVRGNLSFAATLLLGVHIQEFLSYFRTVTDIDYNLTYLTTKHGEGWQSAESNRGMAYSGFLSWLTADSVEILIQKAKALADSQVNNPKLRALCRLIPGIHKKDPEARVLVVAQDTLIQRHLEASIPALLAKEGACQARMSFTSFPRFYLALHKLHRAKRSMHIVLYNYSLETIRRIEVYKSRAAGTSPSSSEIHLLTLKGSFEEMDFLKEIRAEKEVFVDLIRMKGVRPAPQVLPSREAGGLRHGAQHVLDIDLRELSSKLPLSLYKRFAGKFAINFKMLPIGDYVINGTHFIERKAIDDFVGSVVNGRLFKQVRSLLHHHGNAYLLLEFPPDTQASLYSYEIRHLVNLNIIDRLVVVLLTFKKLRVVFTNSDKISGKLVDYLSKKIPAESVVSKNPGRPSADPSLIESLINIPGIDYSNYHVILKSFGSFRELMAADRFKLTNLLGAEAGTKAHNFFSSRFE